MPTEHQHDHLTWVVHAPLQHSEGVCCECVDFVPQSSPTVQRQVPQAGLPLPIAGHLLRRLPEAVAETQVVTDGVFPAFGCRYEEREVLPGERIKKKDWPHYHK